MKPESLFCCLLSILFSLQLFSQKGAVQKDTVTEQLLLSSGNPQLKNELKFNLAYILFAMPEFTYEKCVNEGVGLGTSVTFSMNHDDYSFNYGVTPFMRVYFGSDYASGFFVEISTMLFSYNKAHDDTDIYGQKVEVDANNEMGFGVGGAIGTKIVSSRKWVCDLYLGVIRTTTYFDAQPRIGVNIGPRI